MREVGAQLVRIITVLSVVVASILLTACSGSDAASNEPTETAATTAPRVELPPTATPEPQPTSAPTAATPPTSAAVPTATPGPDTEQSAEDYSSGVDDLAAPFQLPGARGEEYSLEQFRGDKNVVLIFYRAFW